MNVDVMITLSRGGLKFNPNHVGFMKIAKNRRGEEGIVVPYIRLNNGRFRVISDLVMNQIKSILVRRNFTDSDIDTMEKDMEAKMNMAAQIVQNAKNQQAQKSNNSKVSLSNPNTSIPMDPLQLFLDNQNATQGGKK